MFGKIYLKQVCKILIEKQIEVTDYIIFSSD